MKPFLGESWVNRSEHEHGSEGVEDRYVKSFLKLEKLNNSVPTRESLTDDEKEFLQDTFKDVVEAAGRYTGSVNAHVAAKLKKNKSAQDFEVIKTADEYRRQVHEGLISYLTVLQRSYRKYGIDVSAFDDIMNNRDQIREWAQSVVTYLSKQMKGGVS